MLFVTNAEQIEFLERAFGTVEIHSKNNVQIKCPRCEEESRKLGIVLKKRKLAIALDKNCIFHCWVCPYKGRLVKLIRDYSTTDLLLEYLRRFADSGSLKATVKEEKKEFSLPADFRLLATNQNSNDYSVQKALEYARARGCTGRDLWYFKFGVSDQWPWKGRLLMPSFNQLGELDYLVGRSWAWKGGDGKYWDAGVVSKNRIAFNEINLDWSKEITIVEGPMDLVKCDDNATMLLGSDLRATSYLFGMIVRNATPVVLALDPDMAAKKTPEVISMLLRGGVRVRVLNCFPHDDVGEMTKEQFLQKKKEAKPWDRMSLLRHKISMI